jgi:2-keto-4-pentenoate hydratase/2-oxohepta-3-ene-1,7-dioic acid hydratase in catechol pathway
MRYCRFVTPHGPQYGAVETVNGVETIVRTIEAPDEDARANVPTTNFKPLPLASAHLLAPVTPTKIVCVGRNYREHASELGNEVPAEPLIFLKPPSALLSPGGEIQLPPQSTRVDYEGELGVVIGRVASKLAADADVRGVIRGYTIVNDVTARDLQKKDSQWTRAKGFDTFCPVGPVVSDEVDAIGGSLRLVTRLNGEERQRAETREFIFGIVEVVRYISQVMTLYPGDLIATGTPAGVAPMKAGDVVEVEITGLGTLRNVVA